MSVTQILSWLSYAPGLIAEGAATIDAIKAAITVMHPALSEADLNALLGAIQADAVRRKALSQGDIDAAKPAA